MRFAFPLILTALISAIASSARAKEEPVTQDARSFFRQAEFGRARLSPTGRYLAVAVPRGETTSLAVVDLQDMSISANLSPGKRTHAANFAWASDERLIFSAYQKKGYLDFPIPDDRLYAANANGKKRVRILGGDSFVLRGYRVVDMLPNEPDVILVQIAQANYYHRIYRLNILNGKKIEVGISPVRNGWVAADHDGTIRLAFGNSKDAETIFVHRSSDSDEWSEIARASAATRGIEPVSFFPDNQRLLVSAPLSGSTDGLAILDTQDGSLKTLVHDDRYDIHESYQGSTQILTAADNRTPIGVAYATGKQALRFFEPEHADALIYKQIAKTFPGHVLRFGNFTRDGNTLLIHVSSDRSPGEFFLFDRKANSLAFLLSTAGWIDPESMNPMQPVQIQTRDGLLLDAYLSQPADGDGPFPFVILPHGGPHGIRDYWQWHPEAQYLSHHGYAVLQVNYRGSGGYGSEFQKSGYKRWGQEMQDDLTDATHWAIEQGIADKNRMCIYGASYGGYAAMMGVIREPNLYQCAASYVGVYDIENLFDNLDFDQSEFRAILEKYHGTDPDFWRKHSPITHVDKIEVPLFIATGKKDDRISFQQHKDLIKALEKRDHPVEVMVRKKEGHGFYNEDNRVEFYERLLAFLDKHLKSTSE